MNFDARYSPMALGEMKRELEFIMRPCSLRLDWRMLDDSISKQSFPHLVVARFKGACRTGGPSPGGKEEISLGLTHISEGEILPFLDVDCDRVRGLVQSAIAGENVLKMDQLLGRALGWVVAHELYHIFAATRHHARAGVAKPVLTAHELVEGRLEFEENEPELIHRKIAGTPLLSAGEIADGSKDVLAK